MARKIKVSLNDGTNEVIDVKDDFELAPSLEDDSVGWLHVETAGGGEYAIPMRLVVAVVLNDQEPKPKRKRAST